MKISSTSTTEHTATIFSWSVQIRALARLGHSRRRKLLRSSNSQVILLEKPKHFWKWCTIFPVVRAPDTPWKEQITKPWAPRILAVAKIPGTSWECSLARGAVQQKRNKEQHHNQKTCFVSLGKLLPTPSLSFSIYEMGIRLDYLTE